jgi:glutamate synthase (NADPH/NADH) large chain
MALASDYPQAQGLYDPASEHDACGVAMVATLNKVATHEIVSKALTALRNMEHRGASGAEPDSGDGAGILIRIPDAYFQACLLYTSPSPRDV